MNINKINNKSKITKDIKNINCINELCPYFFSSDGLKICYLANENYISDKCKGIDKIKPKMEYLSCKIAKLTNEYNKLEYLEDYIRSKQNNNIKTKL